MRGALKGAMRGASKGAWEVLQKGVGGGEAIKRSQEDIKRRWMGDNKREWGCGSYC